MAFSVTVWLGLGNKFTEFGLSRKAIKLGLGNKNCFFMFRQQNYRDDRKKKIKYLFYVTSDTTHIAR